MNNTISFTKVRDVKSPSQAYTNPAGADFYIPEYNEQFRLDLESKNQAGNFELSVSTDCKSMTITIMPHCRILIPSGIKVEMSNKDTCLLAANKSGVSSKLGLDHLAELVDADYNGEIHINLFNTSNDPVSIKTGDKIIQFMNVPIIYPNFVEHTNECFDKLVKPSQRGTSGFGSSGNT